MNLKAENGEWFFLWKGRVGLYLILKALGIGSGDEIILPGFTCVVVANAIIYLGAKPVYADIDPETYTITAYTIEKLITPRTRVIIIQNTFGLPPNYDPIMALAQERGIFVIEDCAHGLGSSYKGRLAGTVTQASFFSTQWSKPLSTGLGGIVFVRDKTLADKFRPLYLALSSPSLFEQIQLVLQTLIRPIANQPILYYWLVDMYRFLTQKVGFSIGSSSGDELTTIRMPKGHLEKMGYFQKKGWEIGLSRIDQKIYKRRKTAQFYDEYFLDREINIPLRPNYSEHGMLRYVVRVTDKQNLLEKARRNHIPLGDWFISPLHPVQKQLEMWHYYQGQCPQAEKACKELINLFTDNPLTITQLQTLFP